MSTGSGSPADGRAHQEEPIRVLIVDDHTVVRQRLRTSLALHDGLSHTDPSAFPKEVVAEATNVVAAAHLARLAGSDVILLDLQMPVMDRNQAARPIKDLCPSCRVVALTVHGHDAARQKAVRVGADVFL